MIMPLSSSPMSESSTYHHGLVEYVLSLSILAYGEHDIWLPWLKV
jgi:hypothetical protein